jgi:hypothetical protein
MQENPLFIFELATTDKELPLLKRDLQLVQGKSRHGKCYAQALWMRQIFGQTFNVIRRISIGR